MKEPTWSNIQYDPIDYQSISYYSAPRKKSADSLDEVFKKIARERGVDPKKLLSEFESKRIFLTKMYEHSVFEFHDVQKAINEYYKDPEGTLAKLG